MRVVHALLGVHAVAVVAVNAAATGCSLWGTVVRLAHKHNQPRSLQNQKQSCSPSLFAVVDRRQAVLAFGSRTGKRSQATSTDTISVTQESSSPSSSTTAGVESAPAASAVVVAETVAVDKKKPVVYESDAVDAVASKNPLLGVVNAVREGWVTVRRGSTGLVTNYLTSREIRKRVKAGQGLTYGEHAHLARGKQDLNKLISFALLWGLAPEMAPMMAIYFPAMAPSTFEKPDAAEVKYQRFSLLRVKATLGGLAELEEDLLKKRNKRADKQAFVRDQMAEARKILEARGKREVFERFQDQMVAPEPQSKKEAKKAALRVALGIPAPVVKGIGKGMGMAFPFAPAFYIRPKLRQYVKELGEADEVLKKQALDTLSESELHEACNARGMEVAGRSAGELKKGLAEWLKLTSGPIDGGSGAREGMVFVPERARILALGLNFLETVREGRQAELSRKALSP